MSDGHHTRSHAAVESSTTAAKPIGTCWRCGGVLYQLLAHSCTTNAAATPPHATPDCPCCAAGGCPSCDAGHHAGERSHDFTGPGHSITRPTPDRAAGWEQFEATIRENERLHIREAILDATVEFPDGRSEPQMWFKRREILALLGFTDD